MQRPSVFLGLGSNLGEPRSQLERALSALAERGVEVATVSSWYETAPVGGPPQPWFVNGAAGVRFGGSAEDLLDTLQDVESEQGRRRDLRFGPRTLDLDLLLFSDRVTSTPHLILPHPRLAVRRFVLVPMVEIAPDVVEPVTGLTMRDLLERCPDRSEVVPLAAAEPRAGTR